MPNSRLILLFLGLAFVGLFGPALRPAAPAGEPYALHYPAGWPAPAYDFSRNPLTREGVALGRQLFYDPMLSRDSTVSCSSCHLSYTAFTHVDHALSHGIGDRIGTRNSPALMNLAWSRLLMWDGAVNHLDVQALAPISNPVEMDENIAHVVEKLSRHPRYPALFRAAFGDERVSGERVLKALAQFELTLVSADSRYDRVMQGRDTFSRQEQNGYRLFHEFCADCHAEPFFTHFGFEKNGLPPDTALLDYGRMRISGLAADSLKFKVPSLRNIEFSYPYMHDGRFKKLRDVVNFYTQSTALDRKVVLSADEKTDLIAFLLTLSDRAFLFNEDFAFPKN
ncbi:MAG TPA: cytochrome c peroxidase [Saprospiraceae bacterium]|nr:cytochrome c peroxidase [Saprospiraceae bacterium]